jgi:hypothetical protein
MAIYPAPRGLPGYKVANAPAAFDTFNIQNFFPSLTLVVLPGADLEDPALRA